MLVLGVQVADLLGGVADHTPVLLEPSNCRVDGASLAALSLQSVDQVFIRDHVKLVGCD